MKFKLISIGTKFKYENETYIKTSPLIASNLTTGHNKMIPFYAELTLLDESGKSQQKVKHDLIKPDEILNSFNLFYEQCITILDDRKILSPEIKNELDHARDQFTRPFLET